LEEKKRHQNSEKKPPEERGEKSEKPDFWEEDI